MAACGSSGGSSSGTAPSATTVPHGEGSAPSNTTSATTAAGSTTTAAPAKLKVKGTTGPSLVPTPRDQTVIIDQGPLTVFDSFNPLIPNGENYQNGVTQCAKEFAFYLNMASGQLQYWQGKSWSYNKDFTECTLTLRPEVKWSDGKPCTSKDVVFTTELMQKNQAAVQNSSWTTEVASVKATSPTATVFKLNVSDPRFHYNFICQIVTANLLILPEHIWSTQSVTNFKNDPPVYTGPYKLKLTNQNLGLVIWEKTDNYWAKSMMDPAPPFVCFRNAPTDADLENEQFKQYQTDYNGSSTAFQFGVELKKSGYETVQITNFVDSDQRTMIVNCDPSRGALSDPKFRYAISCLINRPKIIANVWPVPTVADVYPWPSYPNTDRWDNKSVAANYAKYQQYNPTLAGQLLDELGIKSSGSKRQLNGKDVTLEMISPASSAGTQAPEYIMGQLLAEELTAIGITTNIKQPSSAVYSELINKGTYDIRSEWFGGAILDQYQLYEQFNSKYYEPLGKAVVSGNYDQMRFKSAAFDATINKLQTLSPTAASSVPTYNTALNQFYEYLPIVPYLQTVYSHISSNRYWTGWPTDTDLYQIPSNWWAQFLFVIGSLKPVPQS